MTHQVRWVCIVMVMTITGVFFLPFFRVKTLPPYKQIEEKNTLGFPVRLLIPSLHVDTYIQQVGVTSGGIMENPINSTQVGWFNLGPRPGEKGSAVIAGHIDGNHGEVGVFANLHKIAKGDKVFIEDRNGKSLTFIVAETRRYDPGYAEEVFSKNDISHLNLITCDGSWDGAKKSYTKRLVVFTNIMQ